MNFIDKIKIDSSYLKKTLNEMIKINSILGNESNLAYFLKDEMEKLGFKTELDLVAKNRENLYAEYCFNKKGRTLTYNGHIDTVEVSGDWNSDPFEPIEKDGRIIGLGSIDMKGGIACQIAAIKALIESNEDLLGTIHFTAVVDEEGYGEGAKKMLHHPKFGIEHTDGVVIAEPLYGDSKESPLPLGMTGKILYNVYVKGVAAHAFTPEKGVNAVSDTARILKVIDDIMLSNDKSYLDFSLPKDKDFGYGSFCVLKIDGGYKTYSVIVPQHCEFVLNRLIVPGESQKSCFKDFIELIKNLQLKSKVLVDIVPPFYLPYKISEEEPIFQALANAYIDIFKKKPVTDYLKMITDANTFCGEGKIPTVHFGPKGGNLHGANEYIEMNSIIPATEIYALTYYNFQK